MTVYIAELAAIREEVAWAKAILATTLMLLQATVYSDCMSALQAIANPERQSGQALIAHIAQTLLRNGGPKESAVMDPRSLRLVGRRLHHNHIRDKILL